MTCRKKGGWSAPAAIRVEGASFGFQIGGEETDVIMLVMNTRGAEKLMTSKFTLGGDASVAAGPVGRTTAAQTDAMMHAEILTWSRARGVFAGISLAGATLRPDEDDNAVLYGAKLGSKDVVYSNRTPPAAARPLLTLLKRYSPVEVSAAPSVPPASHSVRSNIGVATASVEVYRPRAPMFVPGRQTCFQISALTAIMSAGCRAFNC